MKWITSLKPWEIFVFGSNTAGRHGKGAAKLALDRFGAKYGQGFGMQSQSFAIPTKDDNLNPLPLDIIEKNVELFLNFAMMNAEKVFLVTPIGTGLAGYKLEDIEPFFYNLRHGENIPPNVTLLWKEK